MRREIECIKRFFELAGQEVDLRSFLLQVKIAKSEDFQGLASKQEIAEKYFLLLRQALKDEKAVLVFYEWQILPEESIRITISTEGEHKEFSFGL